MSETPVRALRPAGVALTGWSREDRAPAPREDGLRLLLLLPAGSLALAAVLAIALSLIPSSPAPATDPDASERRLEVWAGSPVVEEKPGDETPGRRH